MGDPTHPKMSRLGSPTTSPKGTRTVQNDLGHRDPKHTAHYARIAGRWFVPPRR